MGERISIGPVTRIEGHLNVEVEVENGKVVEAWVGATMARGFEQLIVGRDPRDAQIVMQRICGICPASHGLAAAQALDEAFGAEVPDNGRLVRNLTVAADWLQSHILHFYHLGLLDFIDITAVGTYKGRDPALRAVKDKLVALSDSSDPYPFSPGYPPDETSVADPGTVLTLVAHYLKALEVRKKAHVMAAIFGGKMPHYCSVVPGGVTMHPQLSDVTAFRFHLAEITDFINDVYVKDVLALCTGPLLEMGKNGLGVAVPNYLSFGMFDLEESGNTTKPRLLPPGVIMDSNVAQVQELDPSKVREFVKDSWYTAACGNRHPKEGRTEFMTGKAEAYSFSKAARYDGRPVEVGPLARMLVGADKTLSSLLGQYQIKYGAVARHLARALECRKVAEAMMSWVEELAGNLKAGNADVCDDTAPPVAGVGRGLVEAPRGALGHWIEIADGVTKNYQVVSPTTWNAGPRDDQASRGPMEEALMNTPVSDTAAPLNVMRVVRSFDP